MSFYSIEPKHIHTNTSCTPHTTHATTKTNSRSIYSRALQWHQPPYFTILYDSGAVHRRRHAAWFTSNKASCRWKAFKCTLESVVTATRRFRKLEAFNSESLSGNLSIFRLNPVFGRSIIYFPCNLPKPNISMNHALNWGIFVFEFRSARKRIFRFIEKIKTSTKGVLSRRFSFDFGKAFATLSTNISNLRSALKSLTCNRQ